MAQVCVFAMMIFGLNIVTGYTGQISIGHGALVGLSAYTIAIRGLLVDAPGRAGSGAHLPARREA